MSKKIKKTVEELTKNFEEFEKTHQVKEITKEDFEKALKKITKPVKSKNLKDNQK